MQKTGKLERAVPRRPTIIEGESKTDQSYKNMADINYIFAQFKKTGVLPTKTRLPTFADVSQLPTIEQAHEIVLKAKELFLELPAQVRKLIDNDPSKLEQFMANPENKDICIKHGLIEKPVEIKTPISSTGVYSDNAKQPEQAQSGPTT